ncbi:Uncharacterized protein BC141101_05732 [Bacillus toyonensis]|uniref:hypothetical protein n=1 Tax=Bacillus toyonensis TaxID=155322 RepID=UPI00027BE8F9|nr:hypothetical protein [Bacillus toyonensis]EJV41936.1 hypothetical protein IEA_05435 [Bacillus toyonensis]EJV90014.1 hypothetical protein IGI_05528 [Bacillus toyonensis]EOP32143.1 hypothetical protein IG5_05589 [Bacillus toyonensis]MBE7138652.1 hypothetical protein [Bacillus toyonensis]MBE7166975.1 hypothetical protein [Bacillus toyonensis]
MRLGGLDVKVIDIANKRRIYFEMKQRESQASILIIIAGLLASVAILVFQISFELDHLYHYIVIFSFLTYFSLHLYSKNKSSKIERKQKGF